MENVYNTSMSHVNCFCMSMSKCYARKREGGTGKEGEREGVLYANALHLVWNNQAVYINGILN